MKRVYFDTNFFIYLIEGAEPYRMRVSWLGDLVSRKEITGVTGEITLAEALVSPHKARDLNRALAYKRLLVESGMFELIPVSRHIWESAASIRASHGVGLADAIHLAVAIESNCAFFLTNDRRIRSIAGLEALYLGDETAESRLGGSVQEPYAFTTHQHQVKSTAGGDRVRDQLLQFGIVSAGIKNTTTVASKKR